MSFFSKVGMLFCAIIFLVGSVSLGNPGKLIEGNNAVGRIIVPSQPTAAERFAAEELQGYLKKITGVQVPVVSSDKVSEGTAIIVGNYPANAVVIKKLKEKFPIHPGSWKTAGNYDAFAVLSDGKHLRFIANSETALLWSAWDWLESLGVRWIMPGVHGTYLPFLKTVELALVEKWEAPACAFRGPNYVMSEQYGHPASANLPEHGLPGSVLFTLRQRLNSNCAFETKDGWSSVGSGHAYARYLPPGRYFKKHPEWFSVLNGKRDSAQVCFTNAGAAEEFAKNVLADVENVRKRGIPIERMQISLCPNDGRAWCECPECQKLVDSDGSATSMVTWFANAVAGKIRRIHPAARIYFYAYSNHTRPGDHAKPGSGVGPELVFWTSSESVCANSAQPMFSDGNEKFRLYFKQYAEISDQISAHTYYGHYNWFTPWPMLTQMARDIPIMAREPKFYGMYSEIHQHWGTQAPNFYLYPKLLWNPALDVKACMNDYFDKGFGPAGPAIRQYYQILQSQMDRQSYIDGYLTEIPALLTPEVSKRCDECMDRAEKLLPRMDPDTRWRTDLVVRASRASAKTAQAIRLFIRENPAPGDRVRIVKLLSEVVNFMDTEQGAWAFESQMAKRRVETILSPTSYPLRDLPEGKHAFRFDMSFGGPIKFFAVIQGLCPGIWGYSLPSRGQGLIELPLVATGGKITAGDLSFSVPSRADSMGSVCAVDPQGKEYMICDKIHTSSEALVIPKGALGASELKLRIRFVNSSDSSQVVLCNMILNLNVEAKK